MRRIPRPQHGGDTAGIARYRDLRLRRFRAAWVIVMVILFPVVLVTMTRTDQQLMPRLMLALLVAALVSGTVTRYFDKWKHDWLLPLWTVLDLLGILAALAWLGYRSDAAANFLRDVAGFLVSLVG